MSTDEAERHYHEAQVRRCRDLSAANEMYLDLRSYQVSAQLTLQCCSILFNRTEYLGERGEQGNRTAAGLPPNLLSQTVVAGYSC